MAPLSYPETLSHALAIPEGLFPSGVPRAIVPYHSQEPRILWFPQSTRSIFHHSHTYLQVPWRPPSPLPFMPSSPLPPHASQVVRELRRGHLLWQFIHPLAQHQERCISQAGGVGLEGSQPMAYDPAWPAASPQARAPHPPPCTPPGCPGRPAPSEAPPAASQ